MIPGELLDHLVSAPPLELPGILTSEHECQGAKFHSPRPMVVHSFPMPRSEGELIYLCGTCADNVKTLLALETQGEVPWPVKRCFGNLTRAAATALNTKENDRA